MKKTRKIYRIELRESDSIFTDMVLMAAMSNAGDYVPLDKIIDAAYGLCKRFPTTGSTHSINKIRDHAMTIDKGTTNILKLEEVEIMELDMPQVSSQDTRDILEELSPTLHRQTSLLDKNNPELLN